MLAHGPGLRMPLKGDQISCDSNLHNLLFKMDDKHSNIAEVADEFRMLRSNPPTQGASDCQWQIKGSLVGFPTQNVIILLVTGTLGGLDTTNVTSSLRRGSVRVERYHRR